MDLHRIIIGNISRQLERWFGVHLWHIFLRDVDGNFTLPEDLDLRFEFKLLSHEELLCATQDTPLDMSLEFLEAANDRGDFCMAALENGLVVAYSWRTLYKAPLFDDLWICIDRDNAFYGYKALVLPEVRGMRLAGILRRLLDVEFSKMGLAPGLSYVAMHNLASLASVEREVSQKHAGFVVICNWSFWRYIYCSSKVRPWLSIENITP
ncbi:MAG: hypothetical protein KUG75_00895 [Pseudomonadales bacterium]|nr:hypothetical protein [Pseudomonadales bacterium]